MLHDRVLLQREGDGGERHSGGGLLISATASLGKRLSWADVLAVGQHVRQVSLGDPVLCDPNEEAEVELDGTSYVLLREWDLHAVGAARSDAGATGL